MPMLAISQFRHHRLFEGLSEAELICLANNLEKRIFAKHAYIFHPGSPGHSLYLVESGQVRSFISDATGHEISLDLIGPGATFGLVGLLDDGVRSTGAIAQQMTVVLRLSGPDLMHCLDACPLFTRNLLTAMSVRLRNLTDYASALTCLDVTGRLAAVILRLAGTDDDSDNGGEFELSLTQTELASWVAASRGRVNRALHALCKRGMLQLTGQKLVILDRRGLKRLVEGSTLAEG